MYIQSRIAPTSGVAVNYNNETVINSALGRLLNVSQDYQRCADNVELFLFVCFSMCFAYIFI